MRIRFPLLLLLPGFITAQPFAPKSDGPAKPATQRTQTFNPDLKPFYHGVASGDPTTSGVVIWTRVTPEQSGPVEVEYKVATDLDFLNVVASGTLSTDEARDYTAKADIAGLQAGQAYFYYFRALGANSLVGRARTCPAGPVNHLRFAVVSCSNYEGGYFNAYGMIAQRNDLDAVVHLGDYIYEYGAGTYSVNLPGRTNEPANEILTLPDYRTRYGLYRLDEDLIRLHQQHTMISVWDDHESANDAYVDGADNHQPNEGSWEDRKAISKQVYFEWMPVRDNPDERIYRTVSYGDLADLIMLDTRLEGRVMPPPNFDTPDNPPRNMISQTQFDWLVDQLKNSQARWKVIGNQVLFSTFNVGFAGGAFDGVPDPINIDSIRQAENIFIDNWESYRTQRNAIIDTLRNADIDNVVIVTGDSHSSWAFDVTKQAVQYPIAAFANLPQPNPYNPTTREGYDKQTGQGSWAVEFGAPSISSPNFDEAIGFALTVQFEQFIRNPIPPLSLEYNPHLKFVDLDRHGYFLLDLKPDTAQANFYYVPSQYVDTLAESFEAGAFTLHAENRIRTHAQASAGKTVQDPATPILPFGTVSARPDPAQGVLFSVFPNPASDYVMLQFGLNDPSEWQIELIDANGRSVLKHATGQLSKGLYQIRLALDGLPAGTYYLRMLSGKNNQVIRQLQVL